MSSSAWISETCVSLCWVGGGGDGDDGGGTQWKKEDKHNQQMKSASGERMSTTTTEGSRKRVLDSIERTRERTRCSRHEDNKIY